ncbi:MAG: ribokinase [Clostridia bacterium]
MKILNIGSVNIDKNYHVEHFVSEGKTSKALSFHQSWGGKGLNQSIAMARAGATVWHAGFVGEDGVEIIELMRAEGICLDYLIRTQGPTGHAIIQVNREGQNCILIHGGSNDLVTHEFIDEVLTHFEKGDFLVLQNEVPNVDYAIVQAHRKGMHIFLNPSPIEHDDDISRIDAVDCIILNEIEGEILTGVRDSERMLEAMRDKYPDVDVVLTLGRQGVLYAGGEGKASHGCYDVPVVDTTAAGDTFAGYFIVSIGMGKSTAEALEDASIASNLCVSRLGAAVAIPRRHEINEFRQQEKGV